MTTRYDKELLNLKKKHSEEEKDRVCKKDVPQDAGTSKSYIPSGEWLEDGLELIGIRRESHPERVQFYRYPTNPHRSCVEIPSSIAEHRIMSWYKRHHYCLEKVSLDFLLSIATRTGLDSVDRLTKVNYYSIVFKLRMLFVGEARELEHDGLGETRGAIQVYPMCMSMSESSGHMSFGIYFVTVAVPCISDQGIRGISFRQGTALQ